MSERNAEEAPLQFRIWHLLLLQVAAAVAITLLLAVGIFGALPLWIATCVLLALPAGPETERLQRLLADLMAGVVMPIVCLVYDPGVLRVGRAAEIALCFILFQILVFVAWQIVQYRPNSLTGLFSGSLATGALFAFAFGIILFPLSLFGLVFGALGALGTTPFLTAYVFLRNAQAASRQASQRLSKATVRILLAVSLLAAILVPVGIGMFAGEAVLDCVPAPHGWQLP